MKNKKVIHITIILALVLISSCNNENKRISELLLYQDLSKAYEFKSKYPESVFNVDSLIQTLEYMKVSSSSNITVIKNFITKFPNSVFRDSAQFRLYRVVWDKLCFSNSSIAEMDENMVSEYMREYPKSPFYNEAEKWLLTYGNYGTFIDHRDGKKYTWGKFANQIWMTQNLNYDINNSFPCVTRTKDGDFLIPESGRAYRKDVIWDACPDGWDIPSLGDWYSLVFSLGAEVKFSRNSNFNGTYNNNWLAIIVDPLGMSYEPFKPYLESHYYKDGRWTESMCLTGTNYWSKTTFQFEDGEAISMIHWDYVQKRMRGIDVTWEHRGDPIRCIKRVSDQTYISNNNSDIIIIDGKEYNKSDLPAQGLYRFVTESNGIRIAIKYIDTNMFFFYGHDDIYSPLEPYRLSYSEDLDTFILKDFKNGSEFGKLYVEESNIVFELSSRLGDLKGEIRAVPDVLIGIWNTTDSG